MALLGAFCLFCAALFQSSECQNYNGNAGNPVNSGSSGSSGSFANSGNTGSFGNSGFGSYVPANMQTCQVAAVKAQAMFNMKSFNGNWKVLKRTSMSTMDPIMYALNLFSDSIFFKIKTHSMMAKVTSTNDLMIVAGSTIRSVNFFGMKWDSCQTIPPLQLRADNPAEPGKLSVKFSLGAYFEGLEGIDLTGFLEGILGENFFDFVVLSTDYQNYAVIWNCKAILPNGKCAENQVLVMGRGNTITSYHQQLIKASLATVCVDYDTLIDEPQISKTTC